ncbi:hypothetical protein [Saccharibacillus alkalitolerans]|uniref:Type II secretion system protein GspF domain-containing protein n=1 Tax=Saccharibacillus alkalitolerans TaxID=2705290 RepID=A0ABX0F0H5_9BACL|nr:hypothetical protein [Saccharibacillus alkalitolerans]NGZ74498.1 hypothetical protein [Saccharibacillus alkalitolerans]
MNVKLLIVLALLLYAVPLVLWIVLKLRKKQTAAEEESVMNWMSRQPGSRKENPALNRFYQRSYVRSAQVPLFRGQVKRIRQRLAVVSPYDELTLRKETMKITYAVLLIVVGLILALALLGRSLPVVLLGMIGCLVLNGMLIDVFVHRVENRLLRDFRDFLEDNRHQFQATRMTDEAIYEAAQLADHDMKLHGERIHEVLTSKDPDRSLAAYYEVAPNRYLKVFTGIARMIMEYGDKTTAKGSLYLHAIGKFVQDINFDLLRRSRLSYQLNSLTLIALAPILLSFPLQRWAEKYFPVMGEFYEGRIGSAFKLMLYAVAVGAYVLIRKLAETEESRYTPKSGGIRWEKKLYHFRFVRFVVDRFVPQKHTKTHYRLSRLIKESNSPLMIEWLTLRRLLYALLTAVFVTGMFVSAHINQVNRIWNAPTYVKGGLMIGRIDGAERKEAELRTELDGRIMREIDTDRKGWEDTVRNLVRESSGTAVNEIRQNETAARIVEKLGRADSEYLRWWELLIAFAAGFGAYFVPLGVMMFQRRIRGMDMQNEVDQFRMLISILSQFDRMSVQVILEWMERFAIIFKPALQRCLLDYDGGAAGAMAVLKNEAPFPPFVRMVERLENALERISIQEAFDDLEMEQEYYREQKKETMDRLIESKSNWGRDIGFAPVMFMLGAYIIVPFLYVSFMQMKDLISQLGQI